MNKNILIMLLAALICIPSVWADLEVHWPHFEEELAEQGLPLEYSPERFEKLLSYLTEQRLIALEQQKLKNSPSLQEMYGSKAKILGLLIQYLENKNVPEEQKYAHGLRSLYSIKSELEDPRKIKIVELFRLLGYFSTQVGYLSPEKRDLPLAEGAVREAKNLYLASDQARAVPLEQLATLSALEVSELDVSVYNPSAYRYQDLIHIADPFKEMEKRQNDLVSAKLKKSGIEQAYQVEQSYFLQFFSKMENRATSPKIYTKDSFGQKWKVKLGNEIQSETIVNRLAARIGQKFFDLTYTSSGNSRKVMLVLKEKNEHQDALFSDYVKKVGRPLTLFQFKHKREMLEEICLNISSYLQLKTCFKDMSYHFASDKFILEHGTIDSDNLDKVKPYLAAGAQLESLSGQLIGREYVIFRESNLEFGGGSWERLGAVAMGQLGADDDRYWRATGIFQMLLWDADAKEDNGKGILTTEGEYFENPHDLGSSLGSPLKVGSFNKLKFGEDFAKITNDEEKIKLKGFVAFRASAWERASFADGRWMAKRLALLTPEVLTSIFAQTHLPDFVVEVGVYRLAMRIKTLLELYGVDSQSFSQLTAPHRLLTLNKNLMQELGVKVGEWESYQKQFGVEEGSQERVSEEGLILKCGQSHLVNLLEQTAHPSGLSRRLVRFFDNRALKVCQAPFFP